MAGTRMAFSSGTAAAEQQKPNYRPFMDDVCRGNLAALPDRLRGVTQRLHAAAARNGASAQVSDALSAFARTGNSYVMFAASRLADAAEAGVFGHGDAPAIIRKLMAGCPEAADSVPKMLADLKGDLGARFYSLSAREITSILGKSIRGSQSHCPKEIHRSMAELTIRGEFDHIPQMRQLREERQAVREEGLEVPHGRQIQAHADPSPAGIGCCTEAVPARFSQEPPVSMDAQRIVPAESIMPQRLADAQLPAGLRSAPLIEAAITREMRQPKAPAAKEPFRAEHKPQAVEMAAKGWRTEPRAAGGAAPADVKTAVAKPVAPGSAVQIAAAGKTAAVVAANRAVEAGAAGENAAPAVLRMRRIPELAPARPERGVRRAGAAPEAEGGLTPARSRGAPPAAMQKTAGAGPVLKRAAERVRRMRQLARTAWSLGAAITAAGRKRGVANGKRPAAVEPEGEKKGRRQRTREAAPESKEGAPLRSDGKRKGKGRRRQRLLARLQERDRNGRAALRDPHARRRGLEMFRRAPRSAPRPQRKRGGILRFLIDPKFFSLRRRKAVRA